jgi:hypothetical protein
MAVFFGEALPPSAGAAVRSTVLLLARESGTATTLSLEDYAI